MIKKILGMGNALTDILLQIENDDLLKKLNLLKGGMQLINSEKPITFASHLTKMWLILP